MAIVIAGASGTTSVLAGLLILAAVPFAVVWGRSLRGHAQRGGGERRTVPSTAEVLVGVCTDFFDTLGVGSFATTTSLYRLLRGRIRVPDRVIPGTLNVGHTIPTLAQALIYIAIVRVEPWTLTLMIGGALLGAWWGSGVVARWPVLK